MTETRRQFIQQIAAGSTVLPMAGTAFANNTPQAPFGKAEACIFIWLSGGMSQIDTVDPKRKGDPKERVPGSAYDAIDSAVRDVQICKHLPKVADRLDRMTAIRSLNHKITDEHGIATNFMYTGRPTSGTIS